MTSASYGFIAAVVLLVIYEIIKKRRDSYRGDKIIRFKQNTKIKKRFIGPNLTLTDEAGVLFKTNKILNQPLIINFWNTKKKNCKKNLLSINELYKIYGNQISFINVYIANGDDETIAIAKDFKKTNKLDFPIYFDNTKQYEYYDIKQVPETYFLTKKQYINKYESKEITKDKIERQIRLLLK